MQLMRDFGVYPSAHSAFLLNLGLETLALRMERHCENAMKAARFLATQKMVEKITYPGLEGDKYYGLAKKYLESSGVVRASGVISFDVRGGKKNAVKFMDALKLASNEVHVADIRTCVLHPASATHRQLTEEQLIAAGINPGMVRFSVGLENINDIIDDLAQAFNTLN
jgi:O-acetylhomoserine (thiol)-lyase